MKKLVMLAFIFFVSLPTLASCLGTHYIYLIHGINGKGKTFGHMKETLESQLPECTKVEKFEYDTGNRFKTIWNFASSFNKKSVFHRLKKDDSFSMIMHSQGGLVGLAFLDMVKSSAHFDKIDSFITLSTPFHGAHVAQWGDFFQFIDGRFSPFGKQELIGMRYGSKNYYRLLKVQQQLLPKTRALSMGGYSFKHSGIFGEDDNVVPVYSSRTSSLFLNARGNYKNNELMCGAERLNTIPYILLKASHFKFDRHGIAKIPSKCINNRKCGHPALNLLLNHLNGENIEQSMIKQPKELSRFRITLYIESSKRPNIEILTYPENNKKLLAKLFKLGIKPNKISKNIYSYSFDAPMTKSKESHIEFELSGENMKTRKIFTRVKAGHTTNVVTKLDFF